MNDLGLRMCRFVQLLGAICFAIGLGIAVQSQSDSRIGYGGGMMVLGGWGGWVYYIVPKYPSGLTGWRLALVTPWLEEAIRRDFLGPGLKDSFSVLHAAKRFVVFCFCSCFVLGALGIDALMPAVTVGGVAAFVFDWVIRRNEVIKSRERQDGPESKSN